MRRFPLVTLLLSLSLAAPAPAQDGVFIDPDSPTAKEYAIPLESARRQADPSRASPEKLNPSDRSAPLFGEGIEDEPQGGSSGSGSSSGGGGNGTSGSRGGPAGAARQGADETVRAAASRPGAPDGGIGSALLFGGIGFVLLCAVVGAYLARRGGRVDAAA